MNDMYGFDERDIRAWRFAHERFGSLAGYAQQYLSTIIETQLKVFASMVLTLYREHEYNSFGDWHSDVKSANKNATRKLSGGIKMSIGIKPLGARVVIKKMEAEEKTEAGLLLSGTALRKSHSRLRFWL